MIAGPANRPGVRLFVTDIVPQQTDHGVQRLMILGQPCFGLSSLVLIVDLLMLQLHA